MPAMAHIWRSKDNLWDLVLVLYHVGSRNQTQIIMLGSKCLCLLSHLSDLGIFDIISLLENSPAASQTMLLSQGP